MTSLVADRYGAGRVFLVGDSAHRFPPAGGLGLNTGVQDAHNLAWKLAWVDGGRADAALLDTYETERRPIAQRNAEQSFVNAMKILEAAVALGLEEADVEAASARLAASLATDAGRAELRGIVEAQRDHFDMLGMQLGFSYEEGAIVPDGAAPPAPANPVSDFVPTGRPGARLPHAWIGERRSLLDLLATDRCTLIVGRDGAAWLDATDPSAMRILVEGRDFVDVDGAWGRVAGMATDGAILVRPDQHVAWRAAGGVADPRAALAAALRRVSGR
jgi:2,4-dichlorophenol 6-monooxygenase